MHTSMLWPISLLCAVRLNLVCAQKSYTTDELLKVDIETIDSLTGGLMDGWDWRLDLGRNQTTMDRFGLVGRGSQNMLDALKNLVNDSAPYHINMAKKNQNYFQKIQNAMIENAERTLYTAGDHEKQRFRQCYAIANTMINSRLDIQRYYKVRYMYQWTLHFEIGYLSHEILRHYTVVIDLFHLVATRFVKHPNDDHTPSRYMLYMYSVILQECKMIIKLCHMIREVEKKYDNFEERTKLWRETPSSDEQLRNEQKKQREANAIAWKLYNSELEKARADRLRKLKKQHKKAMQTFAGIHGGPKPSKISGAGFGASSNKKKSGEKWKAGPPDYFYASVNASNQKKSKYPHIYGWSVENFK